MNVNEIKEFLGKKYPGADVSFIGAGSDSAAFRVGTRVFRFSGHAARDMYITESRVCDAVRDAISIPIPKIEVCDTGDMFYVAHEMICGHKWSWHKFMWSPRRQRNLADSCAHFLAQLHSVDTGELARRVPEMAAPKPYIDFDDVADYFACFLSPRELNFFKRNYRRIISKHVAKSDMVLCHLGLKGANSVVDCDGNLCGVFDFCNCGIYERGRDLVLMSLSRNRRLYNRFLNSYRRYTGAHVSKSRIADLTMVEFLWRKRWYHGDVFAPLGARVVKKNIATALARFYGLPRCFEWLFFAKMSLHQRRACK